MRFLLKKSTWRTFASLVSAIATLLTMISLSYTWYKDRDADEYRRSMEFFNLIRIDGDKLNQTYYLTFGHLADSKLKINDIVKIYVEARNVIYNISACLAFCFIIIFR